MKIAVDLGYGFVKAMNTYGEKIKFPSLICSRPENGLGGILGSFSNEDYSVTYWKVDNIGNKTIKRCYIGDAAMAIGSSVRSWDEKQINNDNMKILIATAIALLIPEDSKESIELNVGLPMLYYHSQKDEIESFLKDEEAYIEIDGKVMTEIKIKTVKVLSQAAGAYWAKIFDLNGNIKDMNAATSSIGIIDIGYKTVDYLFISKGRMGLMPNDNLSGSFEADGMNRVYQLIQKKLADEHGKEFSIVKIEQALLWYDGQLDYRGNTLYLNDYEEVASKELANIIADKIKMKWEGEIDMLKQVIVTGGGGERLYPYLKEKIEFVALQDESEYANCTGYLIASKMAVDRKK